MAAAAELVEPGVEIIQELETVSPTILVPTLAPCIMGVCKQILEVLNSDNTVNSDALVVGPALATAPNVQSSYTMDGLTLILSVNDGPEQTFTFSGTDPLTASVAASNINGATPAPVGFAAYAFEDSLGWHLQLRSTSAGSAQKITIIGGTALSALGWDTQVGWSYYGVGAYDNTRVDLLQSSFPDPRGIIDQLDVEEDSIRAFLDLGTEVREMLRTESFLRSGSSVAVVNDGDGDSTSPLFDLTESLIAPATAAQTGVGTVDLSADVEVHNTTLKLAVDGFPEQEVTFIGQPIVSTDSATPWNYVGVIQSGTLNLTVNGSAVVVTFSGSVADLDTVISEINTAVAAVLGVGTVVAYKAGSWGEVDAGGTYMSLFFGGAPPTLTSGTEVEVTGGTTATELFGAATAKQVNRANKQNALQPINGILDQVDGLMGASIAFIDGSNYFYLKSTTLGAESTLYIDSNSTALTPLGFTAEDGWHFGGAFAVRLGDAFYADGAYVGTVTAIHVGGTTGRIRVSSEVALTNTYSSWYIVAKNLDTVSDTLWGVTVPTPDLQVTTSGGVIIKHHFLRDTLGIPIVLSAGVSLLLAYDAVRLDVTPDGESPGLVAFDDVDELEEAIGPIRPDNPLAYGMFIAMQNAGTGQVYGLGVPGTSADKPYGTITAWGKVFDFLESREVWGLASMTDDLEVVLAGRTHVLAMSQPEEKGERVLYCYLGRPTREADTIVVSGLDGDRTAGGPPAEFDTKIATLSQQLLNAGVDPTNITIADDVFIDIASDAYHWNVTGSVVDGTKLSINVNFAADENTDSFYATGTFPAAISETFSVNIRGATISNDKDKEIETIIARGQALGSRRIRMVQCDKLRATVEGVSQLVEGFYGCAAKAGMVAGYSPSQPYTNFPIAGFTGVTGSNDIYKKSLLNQGAGGGAEWFVQDTGSGPVYSRQQVTTDLTSTETREQSITNAIDFLSKFVRTVLRIYIGRFNITANFIDTIGAVSQGAVDYNVEKNVIAGGDLTNLQQDAANPDRVLVTIGADPLYPCNRIRVTIVV